MYTYVHVKIDIRNMYFRVKIQYQKTKWTYVHVDVKYSVSRYI